MTRLFADEVDAIGIMNPPWQPGAYAAHAAHAEALKAQRKMLNQQLMHRQALQGMAAARPQVHAGGSSSRHPAGRPAATAKASAAAEAGQGGAAAAAGGDELDEEGDGFGDGLEEQSYTAVSTADLEALGLRRHPDAIAECASLRYVCGSRD